MSSINKFDVASHLNSGSSIVQAAISGKKLPQARTDKARQEAVESYVSHTEPQSVQAETDTGPLAKMVGVANNADHDHEQFRNEAIASLVVKLNDYVQNDQRDLEFSLDEEAGVSIVKVINRHSGELIRQIPDQEIVELAHKLNDQEPLRLFSAHV